MTPNPHRRQWLQGLAALAASGTLPAWAQPAAAWPTRPVRFVVGSAPGGPTDFLGRVAADHFGRTLGQPFTVDNRAGASGMPGADNVVRSTDGHSLLVSGATAITVAPHIFPKITYDPMKQLTPVAMLGAGSYTLAVHPSLNVRTLKELVQLAQARPNALSYGSGGIGSGSHLCTEAFARAANIRMTQVPYKGDAPAFTDLLSGQIQLAFAAPNVTAQAAREGRIRILGVSTTERVAALPEVPTIKEALTDFEYLGWVILFAPSSMPAAALDLLASEWLKGRQTAAVRDRLATLGMQPPERLRERRQVEEFVRQDYARMGSLIRELGITANT